MSAQNLKDCSKLRKCRFLASGSTAWTLGVEGEIIQRAEGKKETLDISNDQGAEAALISSPGAPWSFHVPACAPCFDFWSASLKSQRSLGPAEVPLSPMAFVAPVLVSSIKI